MAAVSFALVRKHRRPVETTTFRLMPLEASHNDMQYDSTLLFILLTQSGKNGCEKDEAIL